MNEPYKQDDNTLRQQAVRGARCMVRVRKRNGRKLTMAVCPACFNTVAGRERILADLAAEGCEVLSGRDGADGDYLAGQRHMPGCRYGR